MQNNKNEKHAPRRSHGGGALSSRASKALLLIMASLGLLIIAGVLMLLPIITNKASHRAVIRIPANATQTNLRDSLTHHLGRKYADGVMRLLQYHPVDLSKRHGAYTIPEKANVFQALRILASGAQTPVRLTINGFRDIDLLTSRIAAKFDFSADSLRKVLADPEFMSQYGLTPAQALALFVDDTYEAYWSSSPETVLTKIGSNYNRMWNDTNRAKADKLGLTPAQIGIIASITDEETNYAPEKGTVGRLYINRLHKGMRLQADPTVRFATGDFTIRRITGQHLKTISPYNTYLNSGLPPGPIRTISRATVESILSSSPHNYLYMCAKEDFSGSHNFAETFAEHSANAQRYRKALDERGIK